jgi:hypothetical protein
MVVPQLLQGAEPVTMTVPVVPQSEVTVPPMEESEHPQLDAGAGAGSQLVGAAEQPDPLRA